MKKIVLVLVACVLMLPVLVKGQTQVMVGDTVAIEYTYLPTTFNPFPCTYTSVAIISVSDTNNFLVLNRYATNVLCIPKQKGTLTASVFYQAQDTKEMFCKPWFYQTTTSISAFVIDSVTNIVINYPTIIIPIDTQQKKYLKQSQVISFYNNVPDTTTFHNFELAMDNSSEFTFTIDSGGSSMTSYVEPAFTRKKQFVINFSTSLVPTDTARTFKGKFRTHVQKAGKDSIYENDISFLLPALPQSGVAVPDKREVNLMIYPNPTVGKIIINVIRDNSEEVTLEVYDLLGNKVTTIAEGVYAEGIQQFSFDASMLPKGSYYVRLKVGDRVITKRLIIS